MFVKIMLKNEEQWYASERLEIPKIQFLDNDPILGKKINFIIKPDFKFEIILNQCLNFNALRCKFMTLNCI